jgi:hypothetical protein
MHIKMSRNLGCSEFRIFCFRDECYLWFCGTDHPGKVTELRIAKDLAHTLAIPSKSPHGAHGALKAGAIACIVEATS